MADLYADRQVGVNGPCAFAAAVTKSDSTVLTTTRALFVGGAGNLSVVMAGDGATVVFTGVIAGTYLPIRVTKVLAATTATNITGVW